MLGWVGTGIEQLIVLAAVVSPATKLNAPSHIFIFYILDQYRNMLHLLIFIPFWNIGHFPSAS